MSATSDGDGFDVVLTRAGRTLRWRPEAGTLLDLLRAAGVPAPAQCRRGGCGTCATRLLEGRVLYVRRVAYAAPDDTALICSAIPESRVVLDR